MLQRPDAASIDQAHWTEQIDRYVNRSALPMLYMEQNSGRACAAIRPHCLNFWLRFAREVRYNLTVEVCNG
jgi:hypothetical protein